MTCPSGIANCPGPEAGGYVGKIPAGLCHVCRKKVVLQRRRGSIKLHAVSAPVDMLQSGWSSRAVAIVEDLYEEMWQAQSAPCDYAFCVTGSGARMEACPYSDMDAFIVLEQTSLPIRQRFTEVSMYVKAMLGAMNVKDPHNLQRDKVIRGFVFCNGGLNPLGIKETSSGGGIVQTKVAKLTDTATNLAGIVERYYSNPANQQNRDLTHIVQGLQETKFGFGTERLHARLVEEVEQVMGVSDWRFLSLSGPTRKQKMGLELLEEAATKARTDIPRNAEREVLQRTKEWFIRVPQFVLKGLCWFYQISTPDLSSWALIEHLQREGRLHRNKARLFTDALKIGHHVRVRSHLKSKEEQDVVHTHNSPFKHLERNAYAANERESAELRRVMPGIRTIGTLAGQFVVNKRRTFGKRTNPFEAP